MAAIPLLDDPWFVAELEKLDAVSPVRGVRDVPHPTLEEWARAEGLVLPDPDLSPEPPPAGPVQRLLNALTFLILMFVGAGAAVLVFSERVESILSSL